MTSTGLPLPRPAVPKDRSAWQRLWEAYLVFYKTELTSEHTGSLWARICDPNDPIECLIAENDSGDVVGLVHFFPHPDTWHDQQVCYLQDLYVDNESRGRGIGRSLIESVESRCGEEGWAHVYWQTAADNHRARLLYDKLAGGPTGFVIYQLDQERSPDGS